jgi:hypothetical protein
MDKLMVSEYINIDCNFKENSTFSEAIRYLQDLEKSIIEDNIYSDVRLEPDNYGGVEVRGSRLETDEEFKVRIKSLKIKELRAASKLEKERVEYERLKKQFGD